MKRLVTYIIIALGLIACTDRGRYVGMRNGLDSLNLLNRTDQPFTTADVQPYVEYFYRYGNNNDQMLAHYLLGRAYHEHGEVPMALQCYHDALDCTDTTASDCDYAQLSRVYAQMAEIFYNQGLYRLQLDSEKKSAKYALLGKDTLAALMSIEQESYAYRELGLTDSAILNIENVARKYERYGYPSKAAISLNAIMRTLIQKGDIRKAKQYMDKYEVLSGLFDSSGNIDSGREIYYNLKGFYYLRIGRRDSAEFFFRKEMHNSRDLNNSHAASFGLAILYYQFNKPDSAAKYALKAYAMNDSIHSQQTMQTIERMQAMYDYTRNQELARKEKENVIKTKRKLYISISLFFLLLVIAFYIIFGMRKERKKQHVLYLNNLEQLEQTQSEILQLRIHADEYEELLAKKEELLARQREELQNHRSKQLLENYDIDRNIKRSIIYKTLLEKQHGKVLSDDELRECRKIVIENLPVFNSLLLSKQYKLNTRDFNVCILLRLGFKSKEISNMLDISQGRVSQICTKVLHEIFGKESGGAAELIALVHELY